MLNVFVQKGRSELSPMTLKITIDLLLSPMTVR